MVLARSIFYQVSHTAITSSKLNFKKVEVRGCGYTHCVGATNEEKKMIARLYPIKNKCLKNTLKIKTFKHLLLT